MEGAVGSYKCEGKAFASAADDSKDEVLAKDPVTKDPDEVTKQPTTTEAEYEKDGNGDHKKKRKAEGEPDKVPVKQNKQMIDHLNEEPPESSRNMSDEPVRVAADLLSKLGLMKDGCGNEICPSGPGPSSGTSSDPVDLELRLGPASWNNNDEKKTKVEGEPDKVPKKEKKQVSQKRTVNLLIGFGNDTCNRGDLELTLGLANS